MLFFYIVDRAKCLSPATIISTSTVSSPFVITFIVFPTRAYFHLFHQSTIIIFTNVQFFTLSPKSSSHAIPITINQYIQTSTMIILEKMRYYILLDHLYQCNDIMYRFYNHHRGGGSRGGLQGAHIPLKSLYSHVLFKNTFNISCLRMRQ